MGVPSLFGPLISLKLLLTIKMSLFATANVRDEKIRLELIRKIS